MTNALRTVPTTERVTIGDLRVGDRFVFLSTGEDDNPHATIVQVVEEFDAYAEEGKRYANMRHGWVEYRYPSGTTGRLPFRGHMYDFVTRVP